MSGGRGAILGAIIALGVLIVVLVALRRPEDPASPTLSPAFQAAGKATQTADMLVAKMLPIGSMDEKEMGERFYRSFSPMGIRDSSTSAYAERVLRGLTRYVKKPFQYRLVVLNMRVPNAFALPGGVIGLTTALLDVIESESQLASILAHELGHVELGHCFQLVKFELAAKKITHLPAGELADFVNSLVFRSSFSKSAEAESDEYARRLLKNTLYDPCGEAGAFDALLTYIGGSDAETRGFNPVRDYFASHPDLDHRARKYREDAKTWWKNNGGLRRYAGYRNYRERVEFGARIYDEEWVTECREEEDAGADGRPTGHNEEGRK